MNENQSLTVADIEAILLQIHDREQVISAAAQKRDASFDGLRAQKSFSVKTT